MATDTAPVATQLTVTREMPGLTVHLGFASFSLTADELAKHPNSLLAGMAAEGNSSLNLDNVGADNPLAAWPEAFTAIPSLFRGTGFPAAFLQQQLERLSTSTLAAFDALHTKLQGLLSFLGLPGPVLDWVRWDTVAPRQSKVLQFSVKCIVQPAVDAIMDWPPLSMKGNSPMIRHMAFLLLAPKDGLTAPLSVYAVDTASFGIRDKLAAMGASGTRGNLPIRRQQDTPVVQRDTLQFTTWSGTDASTVPATELSSGQCVSLSVDKMKACIGWGNPVVGEQLLWSLGAAAAGTSFAFEHTCVDWRVNYSKICEVPLWVLRW